MPLEKKSFCKPRRKLSLAPGDLKSLKNGLRAIISELLESTGSAYQGADARLFAGQHDDLVSKEIERALTSRQVARLNDALEALKRIERGTYGSCQKCAEPIPIERLRIIPETAYCVSCQQFIEQDALTRQQYEPFSDTLLDSPS